jgi:hypothetical protein
MWPELGWVYMAKMNQKCIKFVSSDLQNSKRLRFGRYFTAARLFKLNKTPAKYSAHIPQPKSTQIAQPQKGH